MEATDLNISDLHDRTSEEVTAAAFQDVVVPSGTYIGKVSRIFVRRNGDDADFDAGREVATLATALSDQETGEFVGTTFIKVSWEPRYTAEGRLDSTATRYTQLMRALGIKKGSAAEVLTAAEQTAFKVRVQESYQVDPEDLHDKHLGARVNRDGLAWVNVPTADKDVRDHYIGLGYEPRTQVRGIQAIR